MTTTVLAKKSGTDDMAITKNDDHYAVLAADPTISVIPAGSVYGDTMRTTPGFNGGIGNASTDTGSFGSMSNDSSPTGGFGPTISSGSTGVGTTANASYPTFGSPASTTTGNFGAQSGFGTTSFGTSTSANGQQGSVQIVQNQSESLKSTGGAMQEGSENLVDLDKDASDWINKKWRPVMGWVYMLTVTCDFVVFPILWSVLQALSHGAVTSQWQPLTLQGAGLYHIAMGAVLGIAAYGRTKEKVAGAA